MKSMHWMAIVMAACVVGAVHARVVTATGRADTAASACAQAKWSAGKTFDPKEEVKSYSQCACSMADDKYVCTVDARIEKKKD